MKKLILLLTIILLSSCTYIRPHKLNIEQGNIITEREVSRIRVGMSEEQVKGVMGAPVLVNVFTPDQLDYVYSLYNGYEIIKQQKVICIFRNGRLTQIIRA